jgi:hypothetical protein
MPWTAGWKSNWCGGGGTKAGRGRNGRGKVKLWYRTVLQQQEPPLKVTLRRREIIDNGVTKSLKGGAVQDRKNIDRRDVPRYGIEEAARCLGMSAATLDSWVNGRKYPTAGGQRFFKPLIELPTPGSLSFYNLVEAHILLSTRKKHKVEMPSIRRAIDYVRKTYPQGDRGADRTGTHNKCLELGTTRFGPNLGFLPSSNRTR